MAPHMCLGFSTDPPWARSRAVQKGQRGLQRSSSDRKALLEMFCVACEANGI